MTGDDGGACSGGFNRRGAEGREWVAEGESRCGAALLSLCSASSAVICASWERRESHGARRVRGDGYERHRGGDLPGCAAQFMSQLGGLGSYNTTSNRRRMRGVRGRWREKAEARDRIWGGGAKGR